MNALGIKGWRGARNPHFLAKSRGGRNEGVMGRRNADVSDRKYGGNVNSKFYGRTESSCKLISNKYRVRLNHGAQVPIIRG